MKHKLSLKVTLIITPILGFSLLLITFLNYFNFEKSYSEIVRDRFQVLALDLKNTVEYGLNLGLSLSELQNIQKVIEGIMEKDSEIVSVKVFDDKGASVFDTMSSNVGSAIPAEWLDRQVQSGKEQWNLAFGESFVIGVPLFNNFDVLAGGLAISYSKANIDAAVKQMGFFMAKSVIITLFVFSLITVAGMLFFFRNVTRIFGKLDSSLQFLLSGDTVAPSREEANSDIERRFCDFHARTREVLDTLEKAERSLDSPSTPGGPPAGHKGDSREEGEGGQ